MARAKTTRYKSITRVDHPPKRTFGYFVRVRWDGVTHMKFFSDKKYGDGLAALDEAILWRDRTERELGKPRTEQVVVASHRRNTTGVLGVRRRMKDSYDVFEVTWRKESGKLGRTSFSIAKYGERKAFRLAVRLRRAHEQIRLKRPRVREEPTGMLVPWHTIR